MQFFATAALFVATAMAIPATLVERQSYNPCPGTLYSQPQCCATDVLGVLSLDCENPSAAPTDADDFEDICGSAQPFCCLLPLLDQGVLCQHPTGV
ncbi:fungal hydrophobin-domain-containing protein [Stachybotrys elegans]|uniref:Fungal hydrophobin-domain-containing protein n=1 Tax=Stachybotrys elegans TaxID=80388 RepID=A0A8K0SF98_9HYPO|nr:fungal hydrophobin-domain-containing protein [Stachybotrys elegans]